MADNAPGKAVNGKDLLLYIKKEGDNDFSMAACQISTQYNSSRNTNTTETKCGTSTSKGSLESTMHIDGEARTDISGNGVVSWDDLLELSLSGENFRAVIKDKATPAKIYLSAEVFISELDLTGDSDSSVQFSADFALVSPEDLVTNEGEEPK